MRVVRKCTFWHQRLADVGLRLVTFNGQNRYLTHYVTTLGHTIYVPDDFDDWPAGTRSCATSSSTCSSSSATGGSG